MDVDVILEKCVKTCQNLCNCHVLSHFSSITSTSIYYIYIYMYIEAIQCKLSLYLKKAGLASRNIVRGTQRICSSHYLFPREILLAGKNTGVSMSWLGNFVIGRGFAWELLTFSSISNRAGCGNSED